MGTSQAIKPGVLHDKDWNKLSRQISSLLQQGSSDKVRFIEIVRLLNTCLSKFGDSSRSVGYSSASDRFSDFLGLIYAIQSSSLQEFAEEHTQESLDTIEKSIQLLVAYLSQNSATFYDVAANDAMKQVLENLLSECEDVQEVEDVLTGLDEEKLRVIFIEFIANFIIEVMDQFYNEKYGIAADPQRRQLIREIREYVIEDLLYNLSSDNQIRSIMQNKSSTKSFVDNLIKEVKEIWS